MNARAATDTDLGAYASGTVIVLRPDPEVVDPWFLAGFLSSSASNRQATRLTSTIGHNIRFDPRKVRIPLLPLETQRAYGAAFERLSRFNLALRAAHNLGQELVGYTTDALTAPLASCATAGSTR
jgi:restriction endonuclease S subunit